MIRPRAKKPLHKKNKFRKKNVLQKKVFISLRKQKKNKNEQKKNKVTTNAKESSPDLKPVRDKCLA